MTDGYCTPVNVEFRPVQTQLLHASQRLRSKSLVDFDAVNLVELESADFENVANRGHGTDPHNLWRNAYYGASDHLRQGRLLRLTHKLV